MNIFFPFLFSFSGVVFGKVLSIIAKEEIKPGQKYFTILLDIVTIAILALILSSSLSFLSFTFGIAVGVIISFFSVFFFLGLVGLVGFSSFSPFLSLSFIFLFGIIYGSLHGPSLFPVSSFLFWLILCFLFYGLAFLTPSLPISISALSGIIFGGFGALIFRRWRA